MFKDWKLYTFREHTKGYWAFGFSHSPKSFTIELCRWGFNFYKDED